MPNYKCTSCAKFVSPSDSAKCTKCDGMFHPGCAKGYHPKYQNWICRTCTKPPTTLKTANTACKSPDSPVAAFLDANGESASSPSSLAEEMRLLREAITTVCTEMKSLRQEVVKLNSVIGEVNKRVDSVELRMLAVEEKLNGHTTACAHDSTVTEVIAQLKSDLNEREQESLLNDVQISGLPESSGENVQHLVGLITKKIGLDISDHEIVSVSRKGLKKGTAADEERQSPRPIVVRLARRSVRDSILKAARVRRGLDTVDITEGPTRRIYINEHLTRVNRALFYKVREEARRQNWRYIWTRGGFIFARREPGARVIKIKSDKDVERIFGIGIVGQAE